MGEPTNFAEGMRAYRRGDYSTAIEAFITLVDRGDLFGKLARYYCAMGYRAMGIECLEAGEFSAAAGHLRRAVALIGNKAELVEYLMAVYAKSAQYDRYADSAEVLSKLNRDNVSAHVRLAQAQWHAGRRPLAIMTLSRALRELGDKAELHLNLGLFHAAEEKFDLAAEHLRRAVECDCTSIEAHRCLGLVESARGNFNTAARAFQRACALAPQNLMLTYQLCLAADAAAKTNHPITLTLPDFNQPRTNPNTSSEHVRPIRQLAEYATAEPDFIETFLALPSSDADENLFGVILSVLQTALTYHADYADLHYFAGVASARLGMFEQARQYTAKAVDINPRYTKALIHLCEMDARLGDLDQAIANLQRAVLTGADFPDIHARLGDLMRQRGMNDLARDHYERAMELKPNYQKASDGIESLAA
ncbi:MAG: tetratricopeptide repeat protein [Planctomycetota bacterium]|nr:tetratricopeptide repeat protein [Planctomycetota bacterium]